VKWLRSPGRPGAADSGCVGAAETIAAASAATATSLSVSRTTSILPRRPEDPEQALGEGGARARLLVLEEDVESVHQGHRGPENLRIWPSRCLPWAGLHDAEHGQNTDSVLVLTRF